MIFFKNEPVVWKTIDELPVSVCYERGVTSHITALSIAEQETTGNSIHLFRAYADNSAKYFTKRTGTELVCYCPRRNSVYYPAIAAWFTRHAHACILYGMTALVRVQRKLENYSH